MTGRMSRVLGALAVVAAVTLSPETAAAAPQSVGNCTTSAGAILAVDFSHWGGPILRACGTTPTTGYQLLNQGGWHTDGDGHDGPAFICRIGYDGYHNGTRYPTSDPCIVTPPASAYWSYWHVDPGQDTWSYSQLGAMSYHPKPGSVDLWIFGGTNIAGTTGSGVPRFSPDSVRARNAAPVGRATTPAGGPVTKPTAKPPSEPARAPASPAVGTRTVAKASASARSTGTAQAEPDPAMPAVVDVAAVTPAVRVHHGSAMPAIVTLIVVVLLGATGAAIVLRRPKREG